MRRHVDLFARPVLRLDQVRHADGHRQQTPFPSRLKMGGCGVDQVSGRKQVQLGWAVVAGADLSVGVQVSVVALGLRNGFDQFIQLAV